MNDCPYCDKKIDFNKDSFIVHVFHKRDEQTGKIKKELVFTHYECETPKIEQYGKNYDEWGLTFAVHMLKSDKWEKHYKLPSELKGNENI